MLHSLFLGGNHRGRGRGGREPRAPHDQRDQHGDDQLVDEHVLNGLEPQNRTGECQGQGRGSKSMRGRGKPKPNSRFPNPIHQNNSLPDSRVPPNDFLAN